MWVANRARCTVCSPTVGSAHIHDQARGSDSGLRSLLTCTALVNWKRSLASLESFVFFSHRTHGDTCQQTHRFFVSFARECENVPRRWCTYQLDEAAKSRGTSPHVAPSNLPPRAHTHAHTHTHTYTPGWLHFRAHFRSLPVNFADLIASLPRLVHL